MKKYWMNIDVTPELLQKKEEELTDLEKEAVKNFKGIRERKNKEMDNTNEEIRKHCKILCSGLDAEFIPSPGWTYPIRDFCYSLEALNLTYAKYGVKVTSSQNKSKYGTYRCYYEIEHTPTRLMKYPFAILEYIQKKLSNIDFGVKYREIEPERVTIEWGEITKEEFDNRKMEYHHNTDDYYIWDDSFSITKEIGEYKSGSGYVKEHITQISSLNPSEKPTEIDLSKTNVFKSEKGKYFYAYQLTHPRKVERYITKHKIINRIRTYLISLSISLQYSRKESNEDIVMMNDFEHKIDELYRKVQKECYNRCEYCGREIGNKYDPRCVTKGWVAYICEKCAKGYGERYSELPTP